MPTTQLSADESDPPATRSQGWLRRIGLVVRALVLATLLIGPSVALEVWAEHQVGLVPQMMRGYRYRLEAKRVLFRAVGCPTTMVVGTSMTEYALNSASITPYRKQTGDASFEPIFDFAAPGTRPLAMLGVWRWVHDQGCAPKYLFIEATPIILNVSRGENFERAYLDLRMQLEVAEERFEHPDYTLKYRAELATWWRSFVYRNREPIVQYLKGRLGMRKPLPPLKSLPRDGQVKPTNPRKLNAKTMRNERRFRMNNFKKGKFKYKYIKAYSDAILTLAQEAEAAGTKAIIHTPPVPGLFHELMPLIGAAEPFCTFYEEAYKMPGINWYSEYGRDDLPVSEFSDWLHLNRDSAPRYATRILSAVARDEFAHDPRCLPH